MECPNCRAAVPEGGTHCPSCGGMLTDANRSPGAGSMPFGQAVEETRRAAKELAAASLKLGRSALDEAKKAGRDVPGTVRKVVRQVEEELEAAKHEIERALDGKP